MIHVLATQATDAYHTNRVIYSAAFIFGCVLLTLLFFSQTARDFCRPVPGSQGLKIAVTLSVAIVVISAMLLH